jgi:Capsule polysaccharide biosynthesis protein
MSSLSLMDRLRFRWADLHGNMRLWRATRQVLRHSHPGPDQQPVAFFNASTRLTGISLNAAFAYLAACGIQLANIPVVYFACRSGMSRCVLGTDREDVSKFPPCAGCIAQAEHLFGHAPTVWFEYVKDEPLARRLEHLPLAELANFQERLPGQSGTLEPVPLGQLVLPSVRWALRRHHLLDDEATRLLFREYILSAWRVATETVRFLEMADPRVFVVFNGVMFPEATAGWVARQHGVRLISHEVGFQPFSGFFSREAATAYPIEIPPDFELSAEQNGQLDVLLENRFQGKFTMAGIRFWPEMHGLDESFEQRAKNFRQIVPVFTNVVYDTSQVHANTVFPQMFAWLDQVLEIIRAHPETLFVIRAHPDEMRSGKESRESVPMWVEQNRVDQLPNVIFVDSNHYLSSYQLIQRSKFVMVYNSSIGLESALLGKAVLCGGKARFTDHPIVTFPQTPEAHRQQAEEFLDFPGEIEVPAEFLHNARNFIYYQLYRASLPFGEFLESHQRPGYVSLRPFSWRQLTREQSSTVRTLLDGILDDKPFLLAEE